MTEHVHQRAHVERMKSDRRLVEDENRVSLSAPHLARELEPLRLAAGKPRRLLAEREIAEADVVERLKTALDERKVRAGFQRLVDAHRHQLGERHALPLDGKRRLRVARAAAVGTGNIHVRQELDVQVDLARAVAGRTAQRARVVREVARLVSAFLRVRRAGVDLAEFVMDVRVRRDGRADVDADGRRVDELHLRDAGRGKRADVRGERASPDLRGEPRNEAFEDQRRLAAPGNARHDRKLALGERHLQRLHGMDRGGGKQYLTRRRGGAEACPLRPFCPFRPLCSLCSLWLKTARSATWGSSRSRPPFPPR